MWRKLSNARQRIRSLAWICSRRAPTCGRSNRTAPCARSPIRRPPPTSAGGLTIAEQTLQLLKNPIWEGVRERPRHAFHPKHPERIPDELVDIRLALYSRPSTNEAMTRYYSHRIRYAVTEEEIARINLPVLVLASDAHAEQSVAGPRRLAAIIPGAQFKVLEDTGLWGHWEAAEEFNEAVCQFILRAMEDGHGA